MKILASVLSGLYFAIGFIGLLPKRMKYTYYIFLGIYLFSLYNWLDIYLGQWLTFPLVIGCSLIIYFGYNKNLFDLILALTGYLIVILWNHVLTIPMTILGKSLSYLYEHFEISVYLVMILTSFLILRIIRRFFILPKLSILYSCPRKLLSFFLAELYLGITLLAANFIYGESVSYPTEVLSWNGVIITLLVLSTVLIFYNMYDILEKNHELNLQQAQSAVMQDYTHRMESFYEEIRSFRHDYRNILSTMQSYIEGEDIEELKQYFHKNILNNTAILSDEGFYLGKLHQLEDTAVKSLLYTKLIAAFNRDIDLELEIVEPIPILPIESLTLCRILGILLDNAIEASAESPEKKLRISVVSTETTVIFTITNSTLPLSVPISRLLQRGYSSKERHEGIGLSTVIELLAPIPYANLSTGCEDTVFCQTLEIQKSTSKKG